MAVASVLGGARIGAETDSLLGGVLGTLGFAVLLGIVALLAFRAADRRLAALPADAADVPAQLDTSGLPEPWPRLAFDTVRPMSGQQDGHLEVVLAVEGGELTMTKPNGRPFRATVPCAAVRDVVVGERGLLDVALTFVLATGPDLRLRARIRPDTGDEVAGRFRRAIAAAPAAGPVGGVRVVSPVPPLRTTPRRAIAVCVPAMAVGLAGIVSVITSPLSGAVGAVLMVVGFVAFTVRPRWLGRGVGTLGALAAVVYLVETYRTGAGWRLAAAFAAGALAWWGWRTDRLTAADHAAIRRLLARTDGD